MLKNRLVNRFSAFLVYSTFSVSLSMFSNFKFNLSAAVSIKFFLP